MLACPKDKGELRRINDALVCRRCGGRYPIRNGYVSFLAEREELAGKYDEIYRRQQRGGEGLDIRPAPVLSAGVKNAVIRNLLRLGPSDTLLELGCGFGSYLVWNARRAHRLIGIDLTSRFSPSAIASADLLQGSVLELPLKDSTISKALAADLVEHLADADAFFAEVSRVLKPGGVLALFTHAPDARPPATLQWLCDRRQQFTAWLARMKLVDFQAENLMKADHKDPIRSLEHFEEICRRHNLKVVETVFYTGLIQGLVENIILKLAETVMLRLPTLRRDHAAASADTLPTRRRERNRGLVRLVLFFLTELMKLDIVFFRCLQARPFFALVRKES